MKKGVFEKIISGLKTRDFFALRTSCSKAVIVGGISLKRYEGGFLWKILWNKHSFLNQPLDFKDSKPPSHSYPSMQHQQSNSTNTNTMKTFVVIVLWTVCCRWIILVYFSSAAPKQFENCHFNALPSIKVFYFFSTLAFLYTLGLRRFK